MQLQKTNAMDFGLDCFIPFPLLLEGLLAASLDTLPPALGRTPLVIAIKLEEVVRTFGAGRAEARPYRRNIPHETLNIRVNA
jgi:hypothetical protein